MMEQQRLFEGYETHSQFGRVKTFQVEHEDEDWFTIGETLVVVATVTVEPPAMGFDKEGNLKRTHPLTPHVVRVAGGGMRNELIEFFGLVPMDDHLQFSVTTSSSTPSSTPAGPPPNPSTPVDDEGAFDDADELVDAVTGEIDPEQ